VADQKFVAIGDIHGCVRTLEAMLKQLEEHNDRTFVFVGDYVDRGPDSRGVVDLILNFKEDHDCITLRGNHEQMLLDAVRSGDVSLWMMNGGQSTLNSYDNGPGELDLPDEHIEFFKSTRLFYDTPDYFFVHAGAPPYRKIADSKKDKEAPYHFLWDRSHLNALETAWEKKVVFGHTPRSHPIVKDKMLGIDTGCVYRSLGYGKLTSILLPEEKFIKQICLDH